MKDAGEATTDMNIHSLAEGAGATAEALFLFSLVALFFVALGLADRAAVFVCRLLCRAAFPPGGRVQAKQRALDELRRGSVRTHTNLSRRTPQR